MSIRSRLQSFFALSETRSMWDPWVDVANIGGRMYPLGLNQTLPGAKQEDIDGSFDSFVNQAYLGNGLIFAIIDARRRLFVQARFKYRRLAKGRPGDLWGDTSLGILDKPWPGGTTGDLLGRVLQHADMAGNAYIARRPGNRLKIMRPSWVSIILDAPAWNLDAQVQGYRYQAGGRYSDQKPVILLPEEVAHFAPIADPQASFRGVSWLSPLITEIQSDHAANAHKLAFFENGATPNLVVSRPETLSREDFDAWWKLMEAGHSSVANAYKTLYLTNGADAKVIGANLRQLDFALTQGHGETRAAAAGGVPPIIVGLSEGLQAATYSNYGQARRAFADLWARPMWQNIASSLERIVTPPSGNELWYDDRDIAFLAEDQQDAATIQQTKASTINQLIVAGFKADEAVKAVEAGDMSLLIGQHTGLFSVQLQEPGSSNLPTALGDQVVPVTMPAMTPTNGSKSDAVGSPQG